MYWLGSDRVIGPMPRIIINCVNVADDCAPSFFRNTNEQVGITYTVGAADEFKLIVIDNASPVSVIIPSNSNVKIPVGARMDIIQKGTGKVTISGGSGVTISSKGGNKSISGQYVAVSIIQNAIDYWFLIGDLIA